MKISHKLIIGYLLVASLASVTTFFSLRSYQHINGAFNRLVENPVPFIKSLENLKYAGIRIVASTSEFAFIKSEAAPLENEESLLEEEKELLISGHQQYEKSFNEYQELINRFPSAEDSQSLEVIRNAGMNLLASADDLVQMKHNGISGELVLEKKEEFERNEQIFLKLVDEQLTHYYGKFSQENKNVQETIAESTYSTIIITILTFIFAVGLGLFVSQIVFGQLNKLKQATKAIGNGNFESYVEINSKDEIGDLANTFNLMVDQLKYSRAELLSANDFTEQIINSMVDFVVVVDLDLKIKKVNQATLKLNGYEEHELIGQSVNILMEGRQFSKNGVDILRKTRAVNNLDKVIRAKNGSLIPISSSISMLTDQNGNDCGIVCVGKDVTELVKAKEELEKFNQKLQRSNRELQEFAYVASHDLQEPLRKVQAFSDRLVRKYGEKLEGDGLDYIQRMQSATGRMQTLIQDLLTFSRVSTKAQPFVEVDLEKITNEVLSDLEVKIEETGANVEIGELPKLDADPSQMRQLMQNLIGNALKFRRQDTAPFVKIKAQPYTNGHGENGSCQIFIEDNGIGFDEKYTEKIFTVFQRLHGRSDYEGSGVGLAVCRKIVDRHNGDITAKSAPDEGATFIITLPLKQQNTENN